MRSSIVRLVGRGWTRKAFVAMALCALAQPLLTPLAPGLAGWAPTHGHIYVNGIYVNGEVAPHSHPWDREPSGRVGHGDVPPGFIYHPCEIHPDGLVPLGDATAGATAPGETGSDGAAGGSASSQDVVFLFDLNVSGSILPAPEVPALVCSSASFAANVATPLGPGAVYAWPAVPPPRG